MSCNVRALGAGLFTGTGRAGVADEAVALVAVVGIVLGTVPEEALAVVEVGVGEGTLAAGSIIPMRSGSVAESLRSRSMHNVTLIGVVSKTTQTSAYKF